jgi:hypothetical protein
MSNVPTHKDRRNVEIPSDARWITWEIGTEELQRSAMAMETFDDLVAGETHVERLRNNIRSRRKLIVRQSTGKWSSDPSERFVNEHAWVLSLMNQYKIISSVCRQTKQTSLLPGAAVKLPLLLEEMQRTEPREWKEGPYQKPPGWRLSLHHAR